MKIPPEKKKQGKSRAGQGNRRPFDAFGLLISFPPPFTLLPFLLSSPLFLSSPFYISSPFLVSRCPFCESLVVPTLTIRVRDYRSAPRGSFKSDGGSNKKRLNSEDSALASDVSTGQAKEEEATHLSPPPAAFLQK